MSDIEELISAARKKAKAAVEQMAAEPKSAWWNGYATGAHEVVREIEAAKALLEANKSMCKCGHGTEEHYGGPLTLRGIFCSRVGCKCESAEHD